MTLPSFPALTGQTFRDQAARSPRASSPNMIPGARFARRCIRGSTNSRWASRRSPRTRRRTPLLARNRCQAVMGLYLQCGGAYGAFLYTDPNDHAAVSQLDRRRRRRDDAVHLASGDWRRNGFGFLRHRRDQRDDQRRRGVELVAWPRRTSSPSAAPPPSGASIAASFTYAFVCRFLEDSLGFENFMQNLWAANSVKFRSVRQ